MKDWFKLNDDDSLEKVVGGIFGVIAIIAAIAEIFLAGHSIESIVAGVKDVSGTLIVVVLLIAFIKDKKPTHYKDFNKAFDFEMTKICEKYNPVIIKDEKVENRYNIASKLSSIYSGQTGTYRTFFDYTETSMTFSVKKEIFMGRSTESFDERQKTIISQITSNIKDNFGDVITVCAPEKEGFKLEVIKKKTVTDQLEMMTGILERVLVLYFAESNR